MDLDHVDALANAFNLGYARGRADELAYAAHCGDTDEPLTNADRIRAMTDEELAYFLEGTHHDPWNACGRCRWSSCEECCLDWLKEEVEDVQN